MAILVVGAEAAELKPFAARLGGLKKVNWPLDYSREGILDGTRVLVAANGAGPSLAARAVEVAIRAFPDSGLSSSRLEAVINAGFCGALISRLRESDIVVGTSVLDKGKGESFDCDLLDCKNSGASSGTIVTQNRIANDSEEKAHLSGLGALAVDMEAAGVAARSKRAGLPFYCIKVVSDRLDESFDVDLNAMRTAEGRIARGKIIMHALTHPRVMPGLFRLKRRSESAAEALGEFLVSCRIRPESSNSAAN